eukprot:gene35248-45646_t
MSDYDALKDCMVQMVNLEAVDVDELFTNFDKNKDDSVDRSEFESFLKRYSMKILSSSKALGPDLFKNKALKNPKTAAYAFGIVMPRGDRSLKSININERPDLSMKISYLKQIAEVVIDLDAAVVLNENTAEYAGSKFSSGYLPPEMFYQLKNDTEKEQFNRYWKEEKVSDSPLWNKVKPSKGGYVVRSHAERKKTSSASLPFKLVRASKSMDVWSFGLIMFELLSAHVNREDDLIDIQQSAFSWTTLAIEAQLNNLLNDKISMQAALSLLKKLLVFDPHKRLTMKDVLNDVGTSEIVAELHNHSTQLSDVHKSRDVLLKGLFEKTDVPTSFLILPHKLNELNANTNNHDYLDIMSKKGLTESESGTIKLDKRSGTPTIDGIAGIWSKFDSSAIWNKLSSRSGDFFSVSVLKEKVIKTTKDFMVVTARDFTKLVFENLINSFFDQFLDALIRTTAPTQFYFYLVDQYTMEPLMGCEGYPIIIPVRSETFKTLVPYAQLTLTMISVISGPTVMSALFVGIAQKFVGKFDNASVDEFKTLTSTFFERQDLIKKNYCGLVRVPNLEGSTLWTTTEHAVQIERERKQQDGKAESDNYLMYFIYPRFNNATTSPPQTL